MPLRDRGGRLVLRVWLRLFSVVRLFGLYLYTTTVASMSLIASVRGKVSTCRRTQFALREVRMLFGESFLTGNIPLRDDMASGRKLSACPYPPVEHSSMGYHAIVGQGATLSIRSRTSSVNGPHVVSRLTRSRRMRESQPFPACDWHPASARRGSLFDLGWRVRGKSRLAGSLAAWPVCGPWALGKRPRLEVEPRWVFRRSSGPTGRTSP
jgi:hypothetical protein